MPPCLADVFTLDSDCIALSGLGTPGSPLQADPVIPATVTHPILLTEIANGLDCTVDGMEVQPDRQFGLTGVASQGPGTIPTLVVNTAGARIAGTAVWGVGFNANSVNADVNRTMQPLRLENRPAIVATLEPGASIIVGHATGAFEFVDLQFINTGTVIGTWTFWLGQLIGVEAVVAAGGSGPVTAYDLLVAAAGFTGPSSVGTVNGAGLSVGYLGFPL